MMSILSTAVFVHVPPSPQATAPTSPLEVFESCVGMIVPAEPQRMPWRRIRRRSGEGAGE